MLYVAMFLAIVALYVLIRLAPQVPSSLSTRLTLTDTLTDLLIGVPFLASPIMGSIIASRHPHNPIGWICLTVGFLFLLLGVCEYYSIYGVAKPGSIFFPIGAA
jgi:uncharacterized membrane protein HdeD (DUF308 family)